MSPHLTIDMPPNAHEASCHGKYRLRLWSGLAVTAIFAVVLASWSAGTYLFTGDTHHYVGAAQSIVLGAGYQFNGIPETKFPPGFSLILAPAAFVFSGSLAAISGWSATVAAAALPCIFFMLRGRREPLAAYLALASVTTVSFLRLATGNPMSEPAFIVLTMGLLIWADNWENETKCSRSPWSLVVGSSLVVATALTRMIGVAALVAIAFTTLRRVRRRTFRLLDALPVVSGALSTAGWVAWSRLHRIEESISTPSASYGVLLRMSDPSEPDRGSASVLQLVERVFANLVAQIAQAIEMIFQLDWVQPGWQAPTALVAPLVLIGAWRQFRQGGATGVVYFFASAGIICLWPYTEGGRFLVPLFPLILLYLVSGVRELGRLLEADARMFGRALKLVFLVGTAFSAARLAHLSSASRQDFAFFIAWGLLLLFGVPVAIWAIRWQTSRRVHAVFAAATVVFMLAGVLGAGTEIAASNRGDLPKLSTEDALKDAAQWIEENTPDGAIILSTWGDRLAFATGRRSVTMPVTGDRAVLEAFATHVPFDFVVILADPPYPYVRPSDQARFDILATAFPNRWERVAILPRASIYRERRIATR